MNEFFTVPSGCPSFVSGICKLFDSGVEIASLPGIFATDGTISFDLSSFTTDRAASSLVTLMCWDSSATTPVNRASQMFTLTIDNACLNINDYTVDPFPVDSVDYNKTVYNSHSETWTMSTGFNYHTDCLNYPGTSFYVIDVASNSALSGASVTMTDYTRASGGVLSVDLSSIKNIS